MRKWGPEAMKKASLFDPNYVRERRLATGAPDRLTLFRDPGCLGPRRAQANCPKRFGLAKSTCRTEVSLIMMLC